MLKIIGQNAEKVYGDVSSKKKILAISFFFKPFIVSGSRVF